MRLTRLLGVFCVALCAAALALPAHAESAGKVLTAGGDVLVLRASQIVRLSPGASVESGDQIHTGTDGKVLIVFTDSGLVWIRSNSDFVVEDYSYAKDREAAFFSLLKGGARSVTGLIGRRTRSNFRLRVPVATIGIRGTDFSVVMCQRDCMDSNGNAAAKGLYGEVIDGRIAVTPFDDRLLEREFRAGEFFHLADQSSAPTPLFLPPPFLRSKADEQARFADRTGIVIAPLAPVLSVPGTTPGGGLSGGLTGVGDLTGTLTSGLNESVRKILTGNLTRDLTGTLTGTLGATLGGTLQSLPAISLQLDSTLDSLTGTLSGLTAALPLLGSPLTSAIGQPGGPIPPVPVPSLPPVPGPSLPPVTPPSLPPVPLPSPPPVTVPSLPPSLPPVAVPSLPPLPGLPPVTPPLLPRVGL
jgi:hypothetical protein